MARLKSKQINGFVDSQAADFTRSGASDVEFPSELAIRNNFVLASDQREEEQTGRPLTSSSPTASARQITLQNNVRTITGNVNEDVEVFVNGLKISVDSFSGTTVTLSQLAYDIDRDDVITIKYVARV